MGIPLHGATFVLQVWAWIFGGTTVVGTVKMRIDHCPGTEILETMGTSFFLIFRAFPRGKELT